MESVMYALGVVIFLFGVAASIALHECGHMVPAKFFGVKVTQFFVGFGKTIWSTQRGETEYGLKSVPLGGYVKLVGMLPPEKDHDPSEIRSTNTGMFTQLANDARKAEYEHVEPGDEDRLFYTKPWWQKVIVMAGGPTVNLLIATVLFSILFMGFGVAKPTTQVSAVSDCAISDTEAGRACTPSDPTTPAKLAGIWPGDTITSFNGTAITSWDQLVEFIRHNGNKVATIGYQRDGAAHRVDIATSVLARVSLDDPDTTEEVGFLGIQPEFTNERQGPAFVVREMGSMISSTANAVVHVPERMVGVVKSIFGAERAADSPISVVGASMVAGEIVTHNSPTWAERTQGLLGLLGGLNLFLWIFNLLPVLPLDGGHIAGALWEAIRRGFARLRGRPDPGPVDVGKMLPIAYAMASLLIIMSVILIVADVVNPVDVL